MLGKFFVILKIRKWQSYILLNEKLFIIRCSTMTLVKLYKSPNE